MAFAHPSRVGRLEREELLGIGVEPNMVWLGPFGLGLDLHRHGQPRWRGRRAFGQFTDRQLDQKNTVVCQASEINRLTLKALNSSARTLPDRFWQT